MNFVCQLSYLGHQGFDINFVNIKIWTFVVLQQEKQLFNFFTTFNNSIQFLWGFFDSFCEIHKIAITGNHIKRFQ